MASKILSIEVGYSVTRVLEMDYRANVPKIYNSFSFSTPVDVINDGVLTPNDTFLSLFRQKMLESGIKTKKAVFSVSSSRVASRDVTIPLVKENKIGSLLIANSSEYFPVDLTQYQLVHQIKEKIDTKEAKEYHLVVYAVPNDIIESYREAVGSMGVELVALDYEGNSIWQLMSHGMTGELCVTIKVDEKSSMITIMKDGKVDLQRMIAYGLDEAVEVVRESGIAAENASFNDAVRFMRRKTCMYRHLSSTMELVDEEKMEDDIENIRNDVTMALRALVNNVVRVIDYYLSRNGGAKIDKIALIGLGADCSGLSKLMTNELSIKVSAAKDFMDVNMNHEIDTEEFFLSEYVNCIGAAFHPLSLQITMEAKDGKSGSTISSMTLPIIVCAGCVLISIALVASAAIVRFSYEHSNRTLQASIDSMQDAQDTYNEYLALKAKNDDANTVVALTDTANDQVLLFLSEMESDMPSDIIIDSLTATADGVSMSITTGSKESAAKIMMQLRNFESLGTPVTSGLSDTEDENGVSSVTFSVTASYAPLEGEETTEIEVTDEATAESADVTETPAE